MLCFQEIEINPSLYLTCTKPVVKRNITQTRNFVHLQCNHKNEFGIFDMYYNLEYGFPSVGSSQYPIDIYFVSLDAYKLRKSISLLTKRRKKLQYHKPSSVGFCTKEVHCSLI